MKKLFLALAILFTAQFAGAQQVDSIFFHLYTDSLKKGQHNYINVDGKLSNGKWMPLSSKEIDFSCSTATFEGNQLIIPEDFGEKFVVVKAVLRSNPNQVLERKIWIKQAPDPLLPSSRDVMDRRRRS